MRYWFRRLGRLLVQSRIRFSAAEVRSTSLAVGDRLLIAGRLWRVATHETGGAASVEAIEGPPSRARLQPETEGWTWIEGVVRLPLARRDVLVFAVGDAHA